MDVVDLDEDDSFDEAAEEEGSAMSAFIKAVRNRLQRELDPKTPALEARWLRAELAERSWWLRAERAAWVLKKLTEEEKARCHYLVDPLVALATAT